MPKHFRLYFIEFKSEVSKFLSNKGKGKKLHGFAATEAGF